MPAPWHRTGLLRWQLTCAAMVQPAEKWIGIWLASREDGYAASSSEELLKIAQGEAQLEMFEGIGHGTQMLNNSPDLAPLLVEWLRSNLHPAP